MIDMGGPGEIYINGTRGQIDKLAGYAAGSGRKIFFFSRMIENLVRPRSIGRAALLGVVIHARRIVMDTFVGGCELGPSKAMPVLRCRAILNH